MEQMHSGTDAGQRLVIEDTTDDLGFVTPIRLERDVRTVSQVQKEQHLY